MAILNYKKNIPIHTFPSPNKHHDYQISQKGRIRVKYSNNAGHSRWFNFSNWIDYEMTPDTNINCKHVYEELIKIGFHVDLHTGYVSRYMVGKPFRSIDQMSFFLSEEADNWEIMSEAEKNFKNAVKAIIARGEYPGALAIDKELGRYDRRSIKGNLNGVELQWRREICRDIEFTLKGRNYKRRT